jgi:drug/metabolite transporter (DMT)-like permease
VWPGLGGSLISNLGFSSHSFSFTAFTATPALGHSVAPVVSVGLGMIAASTWGGSDFAGGIGARKNPALLVVASGHFVTLLVLLAVCGVGHLPFPPEREFLEGAIGGLEGSLALVTFYRALAMGAMGLTATLTGLLTALVPVLYGLWTDGLPAPLALGGSLLGVIALWLICHSSGGQNGEERGQERGQERGEGRGEATPNAALLLGALSGAGFGLQLILLKLAAGGGVLWALTSARIGGVVGMCAILLFAWPRQPKGIEAANQGAFVGKRIWKGFWGIGIVAGGLDTIGNVGYTVAAHNGRLDLAALVSSLYPGFTILLAAILLRERPSRRQTWGMAMALVSVVLLSL